MLGIPKNAKLIYEGKSKNLYDPHDGTIYLDFNNDYYTVNEKGEADPGANHIGTETLPGLGMSNLALTTYLYEIFNAKGIPTHLIESDIENGIMHVKKTEIYGVDKVIPELIVKNKTLHNVSVGGIEIIGRRKFTGSFIKRYPDFEDMTPIESSFPCFVEFTIKNDDAGDPPISREQLVSEKIMTLKELKQAVETSQNIERIIQEIALQKGIEVIDFKTEQGRYKSDAILADELSAGSMRAISKDGKKLDKFEITSAFLGNEIVNDIRNGNTSDLNKKVKEKVKNQIRKCS